MRWGIYVHIPFCRRKCFYCDFPSYTGREGVMNAYINALCREISSQGSLYCGIWGSPATVYIGGGTPTVLPAVLMEKLLSSLEKIIADPKEFTIEMNPGTAEETYLEMLRSHGCQRLSIGVQSFQDELLRHIGRIHSGEEALTAVELAKRAGFTNISLDLMYGLPGQSLRELEKSVEIAATLGIQHISIYGLQVEEGTVFARQREMGKLDLPGDEVEEAMYDYMVDALPALGYARYEISNFAIPGYESRHNLGYWQDVPYLGLGAAAHSYLKGKRWENVADPLEYINCVEEGKSPSHEEGERTEKIATEEFAFLALRTVKGIDKSAFFRKFGCSLESVYGEVLRRLIAKGLLEEDGDAIFLTRLGMKYGNMVFAEFIL